MLDWYWYKYWHLCGLYMFDWCDIGLVFGIDIDIVSHLDIEVEEEVASQVGQEEEGKHHLLLQ